jgi:hypothetical protein
MDSIIHSDLILLASRQMELKILGGPSIAGNLFEETLNIKEKILAKFSIPACATYLNLLEFEDFPTEFEICHKINELHDLAAKYFLRKTKTDIQLLKEAQAFGLDPMDVLPVLNISTHIYTRFVYERVLLKNRDSLKNILLELNYVNEPEILDALGRLAFCDGEEAAMASAFLDNFKIKYIQPFIFSLSTVISEDDYWN